MTTTTDFNVTPYFDDYEEEKNFHRVLFRPAVPVQARELTQLQTILQNQIERFGDNIYQLGTPVKGCSFNFDPLLKYVKIKDQQVDGQDVAVNLLANTFAVDTTNDLKADVIAVSGGFESQNPNLNTLYLKYINTGSNGDRSFTAGSVIRCFQKSYPLESIRVDSGGTGYTNNSVVTITAVGGQGSGAQAIIVTRPNSTIIQSVVLTQTGSGYTVAPTISISEGVGAVVTPINYKADVTISTTATEPVGNSYLASVSEGVIYQKGFFTRVEPQKVVVSKYTNIPDGIALGFNVQEAVVNSSIDTTLLDNASGYTNFQAPGANRLKLTPTLVAIPTADASSNSSFFTLVEFDNGNIIRDRTETKFNSINTELSRRTFEESGNYVVRPFSIISRAIANTTASNTTHLNIVVSPGLGYVQGNRVELLGNARIPITKSTTTQVDKAQSLSTNYGNFVYVNEFVGAPDINTGIQVSLRDTVSTDLTDGGTPALAGTEIGKAFLRSLALDGGIPGTPNAVYRLYLYGITMNTGYRFEDVRAIGVTSSFVADTILEGGVSVLKDSSFDTLVFSTGTFGVKQITNEYYTYRVRSTSTLTAQGNSDITVSGSDTIPYGATLDTVSKRDIIIIPSTSIRESSFLTGTVSVTSGSATVTGTSTAFGSQYRPGQHIYVGNTTSNAISRIISITNNTSLTVSSTFSFTNATASHTRAYPANIPFNSEDFTITTPSSTILRLELNKSLSSSTTISVFHNVKSVETHRTKTLSANVFVKLSNSIVGNTSLSNSNGPWSLGIPDVLRVTGVWTIDDINEANTAKVVSSTNYVSEFVFNNGQASSSYGLASLSKKPGSAFSLTGKNLVVRLDAFTHIGSGRYYSVESYPVNDTSPTSTQIYTADIPVLKTTQGALSLRDSIDFRPLASNTAVLSANVASATVNPSTALTFVAGNKFFPSPTEYFQGDIESYLARKDAVYIDTYGRIDVVQGVPSNTPVLPAVPDNAMVLAAVDVPPYPTLSAAQAAAVKKPEYATLITPTQQRNYTMRDIQEVDDKVTRLEYYTLLNTLEQQVKDIAIPSSVDSSIERFKNGFFVDAFDSYAISDLSDFEMTAMVDISRSVLRPALQETNIVLVPSTESTNITTIGEFSMLTPVAEEVIINQSIATSVRNLTDKAWVFKGSAVLFPAWDTYYDTTVKPVNINIDTTYAVQPSTSVMTGTSTTGTTVSSPTITIPTQPVNSVTYSYTPYYNRKWGGIWGDRWRYWNEYY